MIKEAHQILCLIVVALISIINQDLNASVYQWSVPVKGVVSTETNEHPQAFLWIPEECMEVKAVILGQHNMSEENILEHPKFREEMAKLGIAEIWVTPAFNITFDFNNGAGGQFEEMMAMLAEVSGYSELEFAPIIPIGHSALASYPWNFAAWNPNRTLAVLSVHGDAPLTNLTGSGRPNPDWGDRTIEGVPGLMVEGEYEWWEARVQPALEYRSKYPQAPVSFLCDAGHGHFDVSDELIDYLIQFIQKAVHYRLPGKKNADKAVQLVPIDPTQGWLKERWKKDVLPTKKAAPYRNYQGDKKNAFWYFDKEMARATEEYYIRVRGKKEQYLGFMQKNELLPFNPKLHARIQADFQPEEDGLTFHIKTIFTDTLRQSPIDTHATGLPVINRICGPVKKINDSTFTLQFYRMGLNNPRRTGDIWLLASHPGDEIYKSTVQQLNMRIPYRLEEGKEQVITFPSIENQICGVNSVPLKAKSSSGLTVFFYVKEGPAKIIDNKLVLTKIPPRSKYPIKVIVVAWQYGNIYAPKYQTAEPVEVEFLINEK